MFLLQQILHSHNSTSRASESLSLAAYRDGADSSSTAGAEIPLLLGGNVQQDEQVACYEDQSSIIQELQVPPAPTVIAKRVTECRMHQG